jgi:hypothetical protein
MNIFKRIPDLQITVSKAFGQCSWNTERPSAFKLCNMKYLCTGSYGAVLEAA